MVIGLLKSIFCLFLVVMGRVSAEKKSCRQLRDEAKADPKCPGVNFQLVVCSGCATGDAGHSAMGRPARASALCTRRDEIEMMQKKCRDIEAEKENLTPSFMGSTRSSRNRQMASSTALKSATLAPSRSNRSAKPGHLKSTGKSGPRPTLRSLYPEGSQAPMAFQKDRYVCNVTDPKDLKERREREMRGTAKDVVAQIGQALLPNASEAVQVNFVANAAAERALKLRKEEEEKARKAKKAKATVEAPVDNDAVAGSSNPPVGSTGRRNKKRGSKQKSPTKQPTERRARRDDVHDGADDVCAYQRIDQCKLPPSFLPERKCADCNVPIHHMCQGEYLGAQTLPVGSKEFYCPKCIDNILPNLHLPQPKSAHTACANIDCDDQCNDAVCGLVGSGAPPPPVRSRRKVVARRPNKAPPAGNTVPPANYPDSSKRPENTDWKKKAEKKDLVQELQEQVAFRIAGAQLRKMQGVKPEKRRAIMSMFAPGMSKELLSVAIGEDISDREFHAARLHAKKHGPFEAPMKKIVSKMKVKPEAIDSFLRHLDEADVLQRHAVGQKIVSLLMTDTTIDSVSITQSIHDILTDYLSPLVTAAALEEQGIVVPENRCSHRCNQCTALQCYRGIGHDGQCKFTPPNGISPSSVRVIVKTFTAGEIVSLAGLDDEDTIKGYNNFICLREIVERLGKIYNLDATQKGELIDAINDIETYHKTDFVKHLERKGSESIPICGCLPFQFSNPNSRAEQFSCDRCSNKAHTGPCTQCQKSFDVFDALKKICDEANESPLVIGNVNAQDELVEIVEDLKECRKNLIDYRAHIAMKYDEANYDKEQMRTLKNNECIVVSDWKMKILSAYFRENQKAFFGKRGTSCLGFMVMWKGEEEGTVNCNFHLLFTNDTCQDSLAVVAGKAYLYNELLPDQIEKVYYRADGAGCYSSNASKAAILHWKQWTNGKIIEVEYRVSVNGAGKTNLDGIFGRLTHILKKFVNHGGRYYDANTINDAFQGAGGIAGVTSHLFTPLRNDEEGNDVIFDTEEQSLKGPLRVQLVDGGLRLYHHSAYGEGEFLSAGGVIEQWVGGTPDAPRYDKIAQESTDKSEEDAVHATEAAHVRKKKMAESRADARIRKREEELEAERTKQVKAGLHRCFEKEDLTGRRCDAVFQTSGGLERHIAAGQHSFGGMNMKGYVLKKVSASGGILAAGSRPNVFGSVPLVQEDYSQLPSLEDDLSSRAKEECDWFQMGAYRKPARATAFRSSPYLIQELERQYQAGVESSGEMKNRSKYTPESSHNELASMVREGGRKMFSRAPGNKYGPLPSIDWIKSWFSRRARMTKPQNLKDILELYELDTEVKYCWRTAEEMKDEIRARNEIISADKKKKQKKIKLTGSKKEIMLRLIAHDKAESSNR